MKTEHITIIKHWRNRGDISAIDARLEARGIAVDCPSVEALAGEDQLHVGQLDSLRLFADWVGLEAGAKVLDLGSGLGGPARWLAAARGVEVTAVELSPELHRTGSELTERIGLGDRVMHVCADIVGLEGSADFDFVWLQHVDMHVTEKVALYETAGRALTEGGRVVWHDWLAGPGGEPTWPLPWSADGTGSCLATETSFREALDNAGLRLVRFDDVTLRAMDWLKRSQTAIERAAAGVGDETSRKRLARLLAETRNTLAGLGDRRLIQFFGEAHPTA